MTPPEPSRQSLIDAALAGFVPRASAATAEMRCVARPGAVTAAAVWDVRGGVVAHRMSFDTAAVLDLEADSLRARNCTRPMSRPGELAAVWQAAGFHNVRETGRSIRMAYADFEEFWRPISAGRGRPPSV